MKPIPLTPVEKKSDLWQQASRAAALTVNGTQEAYQGRVLTLTSAQLQVLEFEAETGWLWTSRLKLYFWFESLADWDVNVRVAVNDTLLWEKKGPSTAAKTLHFADVDITSSVQNDSKLTVRVEFRALEGAVVPRVTTVIPLTPTYSPRVEQAWERRRSFAVIIYWLAWLAIVACVGALLVRLIALFPPSQVSKDLASVIAAFTFVFGLLGLQGFTKVDFVGWIRHCYGPKWNQLVWVIGVVAFIFFWFVGWPMVPAIWDRFQYRRLVTEHMDSPNQDRDVEKLRAAFALLPERIEAQSLLARRLAYLPRGRARKQFVETLANDQAIMRALERRRQGGGRPYFINEKALGEDPVIWYALMLPAKDDGDEVAGQAEARNWLQGYQCREEVKKVKQLLIDIYDLEIAESKFDKKLPRVRPELLWIGNQGALWNRLFRQALLPIALHREVTQLVKTVEAFPEPGSPQAFWDAHYYQEAKDHVAQYKWLTGSRDAKSAKEVVTTFREILDWRDVQRASPSPTLRPPQKLMLYAIMQAPYTSREDGIFSIARSEYLAYAAFKTELEQQILVIPQYKDYATEEGWRKGTFLSFSWNDYEAGILKQLELGWRY